MGLRERVLMGENGVEVEGMKGGEKTAVTGGIRKEREEGVRTNI